MGVMTVVPLSPLQLSWSSRECQEQVDEMQRHLSQGRIAAVQRPLSKSGS